MPSIHYEVWYQTRENDNPDPARPFAKWKLWTPLPRTAKATGEAVEKIVATRGWILITVSAEYRSKTDKPHHD